MLVTASTSFLFHRAQSCRSFKHKVFDLFQYILSHLMRMRLTPAFAARLLDLQIENSFSMSATVSSAEEERSGYNMLLDTLRGHAIDWFNRADFNDDVSCYTCTLPSQCTLSLLFGHLHCQCFATTSAQQQELMAACVRYDADISPPQQAGASCGPHRMRVRGV